MGLPPPGELLIVATRRLVHFDLILRIKYFINPMKSIESTQFINKYPQDAASRIPRTISPGGLLYQKWVFRIFHKNKMTHFYIRMNFIPRLILKLFGCKPWGHFSGIK